MTSKKICKLVIDGRELPAVDTFENQSYWLNRVIELAPGTPVCVRKSPSPLVQVRDIANAMLERFRHGIIVNEEFQGVTLNASDRELEFGLGLMTDMTYGREYCAMCINPSPQGVAEWARSLARQSVFRGL